MTAAPQSLALVERLVAFDTTSRNSNLALIDFAAELLEAAGARCRRSYDAARTKANLFATFGPGGEPAVSCCPGHTDVVPVDGQDWSSDPFAARNARRQTVRPRHRRHERFHRRGAFACCRRSRAPQLKRPLHFALSYRRGSRLRRRGRDAGRSRKRSGIRPALAIIGEPTEMKVVGAHKARRRDPHALPRPRRPFECAGQRRQRRDDGGRVRRLC